MTARQVAQLAVELHVDLVEMPTPVGVGNRLTSGAGAVA